MTPAQHFGPLWQKDGVTFRLFAPDADSVKLIVNEGKGQPMCKKGDGWYELLTQATAGDLYHFLVNETLSICDPASHFQPCDAEGPSELIDPDGFAWTDTGWRGRPWEETVIYELHVGCFTPAGTYRALEEKLDYLASLGVTAIELMPIADFVGKRGWGYDGVLPYAPESAYGRPEALKRFINAAHARGLMVFLDVVYNHFGPAGNYLHEYATPFFTEKHQTPWGAAINYKENRQVRDFFIGNALYWLEEYHFDGLRFDAVHAIADDAHNHILRELAHTVRCTVTDRHVHLMLENDRNEAGFLTRTGNVPDYYNAQWNDDIHHVFHVLLTGETDGYYEDYKMDTLHKLGAALSEGFAYQDEPSVHRGGERRGEPSGHLPPHSFIAFLQNHDQTGNRAMGERIDRLTSEEKLTLASAILLLGPQTPLLFMGEEWSATTPFYYFCDFEGELAKAVREGRRKEFAGFPEFSSEEKRVSIPDPNAESTFLASRLNWEEADRVHEGSRLAFTKRMLALRHEYTIPLIKTGYIKSSSTIIENRALNVIWQFEGGELELIANFSERELQYVQPLGEHIWGATGQELPAWKCSWFVRRV